MVSLLTANNCETTFHVRGSMIRAVRGVSFTLERSETVGIVGESGSGKSVLMMSMLGLVPQPPAIIKGNVLFDNIDLLSCTEKTMRSIRGNRMSMVFQDPSTSLNPYLRIQDQLIEPLQIHKKINRKAAIDIAINVMQEVGISDAKSRITSYPHEFSGGMRQRVMIAMALITRPEILIADEPTTALDVTVQSQIIMLLKHIQQINKMAVIFITHNLGVVTQLCDRVLVMYAGKVMESARVGDLFTNTSHPYTQALIRSLPSSHTAGEELYGIKGMPPDPSNLPQGCPFAPRCEFAQSQCVEYDCQLNIISQDHHSACIRCIKGEITL